MSNHLVGLVFVFCAVWLESIGQLGLKKGATTFSNTAKKYKWITLGIAMFVGEAFVWTLALHKVDVSMAYPMSSLSFVAIALISQIFLKERVGKERWLGIGLIISGTTLVGIS